RSLPRMGSAGMPSRRGGAWTIHRHRHSGELCSRAGVLCMRPFVFLDRDGTLMMEKGYLSDPQCVELIDGAAAALRRLREGGFGIAIVTNQSAVGRGYFGMERVDAVHRRLGDLLASQGAFLDAIYVCPHRPEEECACRKPGIAMIEDAAREHAIDLRASFIIGDKESDVDCGRNAGVPVILVRTGYGG